MNLEQKLEELHRTASGSGGGVEGLLSAVQGQRGTLAGADGVMGASMPLPSAAGILDMAYWNPRAALGIILGIPRVPIVMNAVGNITSPGTNQVPVIGALDTTITVETWIQRMNYSIIQPNSFPGSVWKPQHDFYFKFSSGINVQAEINSGPRYVTNIEPTPIEDFADLLACNWPSGWPLFCEQSLRVFFSLSQPMPSVPVIVTLSFLGWQFLDRCIERIGDEYARAQLRKLGINSPSLMALLQEC
jgi:hypothetical protein